MAELVYILCALASSLCAVLLYRGNKRTPSHLLLWSCVCFSFLAASNVLLVIDLVIFPDFRFHGQAWRNLLSALASSVLLFGLIWELT